MEILGNLYNNSDYWNNQNHSSPQQQETIAESESVETESPSVSQSIPFERAYQEMPPIEEHFQAAYPKPKRRKKKLNKSVLITTGVGVIGVLSIAAIAYSTKIQQIPTSSQPTLNEQTKAILDSYTDNFLRQATSFYVGVGLPNPNLDSAQPGWLDKIIFNMAQSKLQKAAQLKTDPKSLAYKEHPTVGLELQNLDATLMILNGILGSKGELTYTSSLTGEKVTIPLDSAGLMFNGMGHKLAILRAQNSVLSNSIPNYDLHQVTSEIFVAEIPLRETRANWLRSMNLVDAAASIEQIRQFQSQYTEPFLKSGE